MAYYKYKITPKYVVQILNNSTYQKEFIDFNLIFNN